MRSGTTEFSLSIAVGNMGDYSLGLSSLRDSRGWPFFEGLR